MKLQLKVKVIYDESESDCDIKGESDVKYKVKVIAG